MGRSITTIGFDADDTLWQTETLFREAEARFLALMRNHAPAGALAARLHDAHVGNLSRYGFGIKGFTLTLLETAMELGGERLPAPVLRAVLEIGQEMLTRPVELLPEARAALEALGGAFRLVVVTKGDLLDQERKIAASGLAGLFDAVEIVSDKTAQTYRHAFGRHGDGPERALMVGNSLRSDVRPAIEAGAHGVWVPHELTWAWEAAATPPEGEPRYHRLDSLRGLPDLLARIAAGA